MTTKAAFTPQEWEVVLEGPPSAGMLVMTAQRGGMLRESISLAKAYVEARQQHGQSELLDEIVAVKPKLDHTRYASPEDMKQHTLEHLHDAVALLKDKATAQELEEYKTFVVTVADHVAHAHREHGHDAATPSEAEQAAITAVKAAIE
jgi:hypothetical protein